MSANSTSLKESVQSAQKATSLPPIEIFGAREHNLKNIQLQIPRNSLTVFTGISGSGKSSLAFDTIYAEGQRRYMESFSAYARSFMGSMERPDVDKIEGLSPVISIEQKTTTRNQRSTVGTTTEIYDFLRLLYARAADAFSYVTGERMVKMSEDQIVDSIIDAYSELTVTLLAPVVRARKGHYRELFAKLAKQGLSKVRVDGVIVDLTANMQVDRYKTHDIEVVIDVLTVKISDRTRLSQSVQAAMKYGEGLMQLLKPNSSKSKDAPIYYSRFLMCPTSGISYNEPEPNSFSFNTRYGACSVCNGLGTIQKVDEERVIPDTNKSISQGGIAPLGMYRDIWIFHKIEELLKQQKKSLSTPIEQLPQELIKELLYGSEEWLTVSNPKYQKDYETRFEGIIPFLERMREDGSEKTAQWVQDFVMASECPECHGLRLKKEWLHFKIDNKNISELAQMGLADLAHWFVGIESRLSDRQNAIAKEIFKELRKRLGFMINVGLDYLALDRPMNTLSGGEAQRIRLATQIGTQLVGVLYILDEPSIGLHQRDNEKLITALQSLRDLGNTVLVVEHDRDMMLAADFLVDIGPGAGRHGGQIMAAGAPKELIQQGGLTSQYLVGEVQIPVPENRRAGNGKWLKLKGAKGHNLKNVDLELPLGKITCISGVSGSGKSTLIHETLYPILNKHFFNALKEPLPHKDLEGLEFLDKVIEVDQSPIGRTPRSNPATYTGVFSDIRALFAQMPEAKIRGYDQGRFSFNKKGGRCETCEGAGKKLIEMEFLPDVLVPCETCKGKRYNRETLEVRFKGKSISDVLDMTVEQALELFENIPSIIRKIRTLSDVGLGYISLGQHSTTISGGEAQRVKLATELSKKDTGKTLYILDEPTTGLHFQDIKMLLEVLNRLADRGNTILIIEHNLDVIKTADHIIDMGPEGGSAGGYIVCAGTPEQVSKVKGSHTGRFLKAELELASNQKNKK